MGESTIQNWNDKRKVLFYANNLDIYGIKMDTHKQISAFSPLGWLQWLVPIVLVIAIKIFSYFPEWVESIYSIKLYPVLAHIQRLLFGWVSISIGDLIYGVLIGYLLFLLSRFILSIVRKKFDWNNFWKRFLATLKVLLWLFIIFKTLWGLNYERRGITVQLNLKNTTYTVEELKDFLCDVTDQLNRTRIELGDSNYVYPKERDMFGMADAAYQSVKIQYPFLTYTNASVKPSILTEMVSYAGYSGYYNPFTGEAQVNTDLPQFYIPFVTCHEMAHQLGYASESEASFVGYLAAMHSPHPLFRYSALFEVFLIANSELLQRDFWSGILNLRSLNPLVKRDRRIFREFILGRQNDVEPIIKNVYDQYLKANRQRSGINSYNELVGWVIDYRRKTGKL